MLCLIATLFFQPDSNCTTFSDGKACPIFSFSQAQKFYLQLVRQFRVSMLKCILLTAKPVTNLSEMVLSPVKPLIIQNMYRQKA
jgi:hypothetical protein